MDIFFAKIGVDPAENGPSKVITAAAPDRRRCGGRGARGGRDDARERGAAGEGHAVDRVRVRGRHCVADRQRWAHVDLFSSSLFFPRIR